MNVKAVSDFSGYSGDALWPAAQVIHDAVVVAAATFTSPPITMPDFQLSIDAVRDALLAKASGAHADTLRFNLARAVLEENLGALAGYVNGKAQGNESIVMASGFPFYPTAHPVDYSPPAAPANVVMREGDVSGSFVARYRPARRPSINEVQICTGDPTVEANWKTVGFFNNGKAVISGITPGTMVWTRIRTYGLNNVAGDWSDPAKLMVV